MSEAAVAGRRRRVGGRRKAPGGRWEVLVDGAWIPEDEAMKREPTERQREVWRAVHEHGTQAAAAESLGVSRGAVHSALKGYMDALGLVGPLPGLLDRSITRTVVPVQAEPPMPEVVPVQGDPWAVPPVVADGAHGVSTDGHEHPPAPRDPLAMEAARRVQAALQRSLAAEAADPVSGPALTPEPVGESPADHASDMHQRSPAAWQDDAECLAFLTISIDVTIPTTEMATWSPERIRALFAGVAQVEAALQGGDV
ncbi:hypothetical protein BH23CHL8_BH23CHL8_26200 [soil metagenome]